MSYSITSINLQLVQSYPPMCDEPYVDQNRKNCQDQSQWFTDGSRANSGTGSGIFGIRSNRNLSFPLGKFAMVFQTEIHAILQCACENIRRAYKHKRILIFF